MGTQLEFILDSPLSLLTEYHLSLTGDIRDLAGNPIVETRGTFKTRDGKWKETIGLESRPDRVRQPIVLMGEREVIVVWSDSSNIWSNRYSFENNEWSSEENVSINNGRQIVVVKAKMDKNGNVVVVWSDLSGALSSVQYDASISRWNISFPPSPSLELDSYFNFDLVIDERGNIFIAWTSVGVRTDGEVILYIRTFDVDTKSWSVQSIASDVKNPTTFTRSLTMGSRNGDIFCIWVRSNATIAVGRYNPATKMWDVSALSPLVSIPSFIIFTINRLGNAIVVWNQGRDLISSRFKKSLSQWSPPGVLGKMGSPESVRPRLIQDDDGNAVLIHESRSTSGFRLVSRVFDKDTNFWNPEKILGKTTSTDISFLDSANDESGNIVLAWSQKTPIGKEASIWTNQFNAGDRVWGTVSKISEGDNSELPRVSLDRSGNIHLVWSQNLNFWVRRFNAISQIWEEPELLNNEGMINTRQIQSSSTGKSVLVWTQKDANNTDNLHSKIFE